MPIEFHAEVRSLFILTVFNINYFWQWISRCHEVSYTQNNLKTVHVYDRIIASVLKNNALNNKALKSNVLKCNAMKSKCIEE